MIFRKITKSHNHKIILRTFHYYCYKALTLYIIIINKVLYYMGFHFLVLKFLIMILWFMIRVIAIFFCIVRIHFVFSVLLLRRQGEVGLPPCAHNRLFLAIFLWDSWLQASLQNLLLVYPEKCWFFEGIVINFAKKEKKKASPQPHPQPLSEWRGKWLERYPYRDDSSS